MGNFDKIGGVPVMGFISPLTTDDEYAVTDPLYAVGGFRIISGTSEQLNDIPEPRRRAGMIVGVENGKKYYKLLDTNWDYTINDWDSWNFFNDEDLYSDDPNNTTNLVGTKLYSNRLTQLTSSDNVLDISLTDDKLLVNMVCNSDYNIILPPLASVPLGFKVTFKNLTNGGVKGTIYPFGNNKVESKDTYEFYGKGLFEVTKMVDINGTDSEWVLTHYSNIVESRNQGKVKQFNFSNVDNINYTHDLGYIPIVQVWVEDGTGGYSDINVDVDHDLVNKNWFSVSFGQILSGFVLYI